MAAPYLDFIEALRRRECARHLFLDMGHPDGAVRAWSGVGNFSFLGATYIGVYGFGSVEGISYTSDLQNDSVKVSLNIAGLNLQSRTALNFPYETATLYVAWIREDGSLAYYRPVIQGRTDASSIKLSESERQLIIPIRGFVADFSQAPRNYWSNQDQLKLYSNDTGLKYMSSFESSMLSGWGPTAPSSGGNVYTGYLGTLVTSPAGLGHTLSADQRCIGVDGEGSWLLYSGTRLLSAAPDGSAQEMVEETTGASCDISGGTDNLLRVGGNLCYVDSLEQVQTAGGKYICRNGVTARRLRLISDLGGALGTPTAEVIVTQTLSGVQFFRRNSGTLTGKDSQPSIIENATGQAAYRFSFSGTERVRTTGSAAAFTPDVNFVEEGTGNFAQFDTVSGRMQVSGADCVMSNNGTVLTAGGARVHRENYPASTHFLRVWG